MGDKSKIEWTNSSWNPIRGCSRKSPGCGGPGPHGGCYAESIAARFSGPGKPYEGLAEMRGGQPRWTGKLAFVEDALTLPLKWKKPRCIFVNSMSDLFHENVPDEWIDKIFAVMALCPQHTFQVLTKRSDRMRQYIGGLEPWSTRVLKIRSATAPFMSFAGNPTEAIRFPLPNVWLGVSCEDQERAIERVPDLLATPAAVRFVSAEPLLGPIDFNRLWITEPARLPPELRVNDEDKHLVDSLAGITTVPACHYQCPTIVPQNIIRDDQLFTSSGERRRIDWMIVGGESGRRARTMQLDWARSIVGQCRAAGVPCFVKQLGEASRLKLYDRKGGDPSEWPEDLRVREMPTLDRRAGDLFGQAQQPAEARAL